MSSNRFPTTCWSVVDAAKHRDSPEYLASMNRCIAGYWKPVFYFLRAKGYSLDRAEDLTQEFFLKLLERDWIRLANRDRGRFRTFLLAILVRFLADQGPNRAPRQKRFDEKLVCISELIGDRERSFEPSSDETPEDIFMREWAKAVIANVHRRLEIWCADLGRPEWYQIFLLIHFPPPNGPRVTQSLLAGRFGLTRDKVRHAIAETKRRFIELVRAEVAEHVQSEGELEAEIGELQRLLA